MVRYVTGNIFDADAEAIVNTVNLVGVMGKGVALQFKERFSENFLAYQRACKDGTIGIGNSLVVKDEWRGRSIWIINFPTKNHWRNPSEYWYVEKGLDNLVEILRQYKIKSIALPPLGAGNGGLNWNLVKPMIERKMADVDCDVMVYEPGHHVNSVDKTVTLTKARALLVFMLNRLQNEGQEATTFSAVKMCYFMQKFGAQKIFKLDFVPHIYGPYNDKVRHVLHGMDGAYIRGFADMSKKPFEPFDTVDERMPEVVKMVEDDLEMKTIVGRVCSFLEDYWDDYNLELLSSVDFIVSARTNVSIEEVYSLLCSWTPRKAKLFADKELVANALQHVLSVRYS